MPIEISKTGDIIASPPLEEFRSEALQELISNKPGFLVQWGVSILFFVLLLMGVVCWFIKYPDIVKTQAKLVSINMPKAVIAKTEGKLIKLNAVENETVKAGAIIGYMESTANHAEVIELSNLVDRMLYSISSHPNSVISQLFSYQYKNLGELQQAHQVFIQSCLTYNNYLSNGIYNRKRDMLAKDINNLQRLYNNLIEQKNIQEQDITLAKETFDVNEKLHGEKVISDLDYRNEKSRLLNKELSLPQINASLINNKSQQNEKQKEIMELQNSIAQQKDIFIQALHTFKSQLNEWKAKYLLIAPVEGSIVFTTFLQENQQLQSRQTIGYVNPGNSKYYAEIYVPQANFGKIKPGQQVLLKLPAYPFEEFGSIEGKIDFISTIPSDSGYLTKVAINKYPYTNYNKKIQHREGLMANAEIITKNLNLLQRFYYSFVKHTQ